MRLLLNKIALQIAARRFAPDRIPRSGQEGAKVDCYSVQLMGPGEMYGMLIGSYKNGVVRGRLWHNSSYSVWAKLNNNTIGSCTFTAIHYIGNNSFYYDSSKSFIFKEITLHPYFVCFFRALRSRAFASRSVSSADRHRVLTALLDHKIDDYENRRNYRGVDLLTLMRRIYGNEILSHLQSGSLRARLQVALESIIEEGLASGDILNARLNSVAVAKIYEIDIENERHIDTRRNNQKIALLTFFIFILGIIELLPPIKEIIFYLDELYWILL